VVVLARVHPRRQWLLWGEWQKYDEMNIPLLSWHALLGENTQRHMVQVVAMGRRRLAQEYIENGEPPSFPCMSHAISIKPVMVA